MMKTISTAFTVLFLCAIALLIWRLSKREDHFGKAFSGYPTAKIPDLVVSSADFLGRPVSIEGILKQQCPSTGCWFFLVDPGDPKARDLKVEMSDTTPRLPPRIGRRARVEGQLIKYGEGYEFIADAVTFFRQPAR
jgi:hypothetical protein